MLEKSFTLTTGEALRYVCDFTNDSTDLVVVFNGCTKKGVKARYNYIHTLERFECHKLFILDELSDDQRGCYYLGKQPAYPVEKGVFELINQTVQEHQIKRLFFIGSSKGGWAALNFGLAYPNAIIIAAAPQYHLGTFLLHPNFEPTLTAIVPKNYTQQNIDELNNYLENRIMNEAEKNQKIYLHYSTQEMTYRLHIQYLISALNHYDYELILDEQDFSNHHELIHTFPSFIKDCLKKEGLIETIEDEDV